MPPARDHERLAAQVRQGRLLLLLSALIVAAGTLAFFVARTTGGDVSGEHGDHRSALHVITEPPGATVTIDGVVSGARTPAVVSIGNGVPTIELRLELVGYEPEVRVVPRGTPEIELVLRPLGP